MGNLCAIFHMRFQQLIRVIPSVRKAQLLDYILLGWQTSTYKLKGSDKKWFMKPYTQVVNETGIPLSTLQRFIKELADEGFIERRQALYSRIQRQGEFVVRKGNYIHITIKLLDLLKQSKVDAGTASIEQLQDTSIGNNSYKHEEHSNLNEIKSNCTDLNNNEGIDPLKTRGLYIRDLYNSFSINNIIDKKTNISGDKTAQQLFAQRFETISNFFFTEIKEEISHEVKKLVLGTFFNLIFEQQKHFSSPKEAVAEYLYVLINTEFYLPQIKCFKHRNNILSKLIREDKWRTPKGFYKYFYLGQIFKDKLDLNEQHWQEQKAKEINYVTDICDEKGDERLIALEKQIFNKGNLIKHLKEQLYSQVSDEEIITEVREKIKFLQGELEQLWQQQYLIEHELESHMQQNRDRSFNCVTPLII